MGLKTANVELTSSDEEIKSSRWKDGITIVRITPGEAAAAGTWDTERGSDIDSAGGTEHAIYSWNGSVLILKTGGYSGDTKITELVRFEEFKDWNMGSAGTGTFKFRDKKRAFSWKIKTLK